MCDVKDLEKGNDNKMDFIDSPFPLCIEKKKKNFVYSRSLIVRSQSENKK